MKRLCLFAGFDKNNFIHKYVVYYLMKLSKFAEIHYMADCEMADSELKKILPYVKTAKAYRHGKYDFGSWQELIRSLGWDYISQFDEVILANDSCFAPVLPFEDMFNKMERLDVDFWGNTMNIYSVRHIQSYFVAFRNNIICDNNFRQFFEGISCEENKQSVVSKYEKRLTVLLENLGYKYESYVDREYTMSRPYYKLLLNKSPFIKTKMFTSLVPALRRCSYGDLFVLKMLGYPAEYIYDYVVRNFGHFTLLTNSIAWCWSHIFPSKIRAVKRWYNFKKNNNIQVLITGGAGFIGSSLADCLLELGYRVIVVDNFDDFYSKDLKLKNVEANLDNKRYKLYEADIRNYQDMEKIFSKNKIDYVFHLAGRANVRLSFEKSEDYFLTNVGGTENLLKCCVKFGVKRIVATSSSSVYGCINAEMFSEDMTNLKPISPYAESKLEMEHLIEKYSKQYTLDSIVIRPFTVYGPRQRPDLAICKFIKSILNDKPIDMYGDGSSIRDYTYIGDMVNGLKNCITAQTDNSFEIINIGSSAPVDLNTMIKVIEYVLGKKAKVKLCPKQRGDVLKTYANISKAEKLLNYHPSVSFKQGIELFSKYIKDNL